MDDAAASMKPTTTASGVQREIRGHGRAAAVVDHVLDHDEGGGLVVVGQGAGQVLTERDRDVAGVVTVAREPGERVAGQPRLSGGVGAGVDVDRGTAGPGYR
jgi:hypothetical protein